MPAFVATYVNPQGKSVLVDIEATDPAQAKRSLRLRGIRATEIKAKPKTTATGSSAAAQLSEKLKFSKLNLITQLAPRRPPRPNRLVHRYQLNHGAQRHPIPERPLAA